MLCPCITLTLDDLLASSLAALDTEMHVDAFTHRFFEWNVCGYLAVGFGKQCRDWWRFDYIWNTGHSAQTESVWALKGSQIIGRFCTCICPQLVRPTSVRAKTRKKFGAREDHMSEVSGEYDTCPECCCNACHPTDTHSAPTSPLLTPQALYSRYVHIWGLADTLVACYVLLLQMDILLRLSCCESLLLCPC